MSESLLAFVKSHPFWAILIIVLMVLPMFGAVLHVLLKAFGRRGLDNIPTIPEDKSGTDGSSTDRDETHIDSGKGAE